MGVSLIEGSANSFILMIAVAVGAAMIGTAALGLLIMLMPVITLWLGIMISVGTMATYYLPFVPFMIFLFASIAWLIAVVEVMTAAPLIALGVMHPEGDSPFGKGEQAVMMLLGIFLRPAMMIMGYIFGIILSYVSIWFVNAGFIMVVPDVQNMQMVDINTGSTAGYGGAANAIDNDFQQIGQDMTGNTSVYGMWSTIFLLFFILLVYITTVISVVSKSFEMIHILPDKIMRWISGGSQEQLGGKLANTMSQEMQSAHKKGEKASSEAIAKINSSMMEGAINAIETVQNELAEISSEADEEEEDGEDGEDGEDDDDDSTAKGSAGGGGGKKKESAMSGIAKMAGNLHDNNASASANGALRGMIKDAAKGAAGKVVDAVQEGTNTLTGGASNKAIDSVSSKAGAAKAAVNQAASDVASSVKSSIKQMINGPEPDSDPDSDSDVTTSDNLDADSDSDASTSKSKVSMGGSKRSSSLNKKTTLSGGGGGDFSSDAVPMVVNMSGTAKPDEEGT